MAQKKQYHIIIKEKMITKEELLSKICEASSFAEAEKSVTKWFERYPHRKFQIVQISIFN